MSYVKNAIRLERMCGKIYKLSYEDIRELAWEAFAKANNNIVPAEKQIVFYRQGLYLENMALIMNEEN